MALPFGPRLLTEINSFDPSLNPRFSWKSRFFYDFPCFIGFILVSHQSELSKPWFMTKLWFMTKQCLNQDAGQSDLSKLSLLIKHENHQFWLQTSHNPNGSATTYLCVKTGQKCPSFLKQDAHQSGVSTLIEFVRSMTKNTENWWFSWCSCFFLGVHNSTSCMGTGTGTGTVTTAGYGYSNHSRYSNHGYPPVPQCPCQPGTTGVRCVSVSVVGSPGSFWFQRVCHLTRLFYIY